jgi:hypothetical protein
VQAEGDAERFYRQMPALIGMEATGNCHWLVELNGGELGHELWWGCGPGRPPPRNQ